MSVHVSSAVWRLRDVAPGLKLTLLALADMCNDEGHCWPSVSSLTDRTGFSERAIQGHIVAAEAAGMVTRNMREGRSTVYSVTVGEPPQNLHPRRICTPAESAPTPAESAPRNIKDPSTTTSKSAKGARWKRVNNFPSLWLTWAQEETEWSAITVHRVSEEFQDYWCAKTGAGATKADWQATWRMWIRREGKGNEASRRTGGQGGRESAVDRVARKSAEWARGATGGAAVAADGRGVREPVVIEHGRVAESGVDQRDHGIDF